MAGLPISRATSPRRALGLHALRRQTAATSRSSTPSTRSPGGRSASTCRSWRTRNLFLLALRPTGTAATDRAQPPTGTARIAAAAERRHPQLRGQRAERHARRDGDPALAADRALGGAGIGFASPRRQARNRGKESRRRIAAPRALHRPQCRGDLHACPATPARAEAAKRRGGFLAFADPAPPRQPAGAPACAGHSAEGRPIGLLQRGDPAIDGELLVFGCIHGDECAASGHPAARPAAAPTRLRHLPRPQPQPGRLRARHPPQRPRRRPQPQLPGSSWRPIGERGDPQYSGPRPFSEPETRLAARIVRAAAARGDDLVPPAPRQPAAGPRLGPERRRPRAASPAWRSCRSAACPGPPARRRTGRTTASRAPARSSSSCRAGRWPSGSRSRLGRGDRAARPEGGRRLRCPAEEVRVGR